MVDIERDTEERDKSSVNAKKKKKTSKVAMHCSCGAKKYRFGFTITWYILIFSSAKNSYIAT